MSYNYENEFGKFDPIVDSQIISYPNFDSIRDAIDGRKKLEFFYDGYLRKDVEPHLLGLSSKSNILLRCWQDAGQSRSGKVPEWKLFNLRKINSLRENGRIFSQARPEYNPNDRHMKRIYARI
tara:strand:- start:513 stop:881 length:369 start_codon:yes stop_codon:yes gene_type:complete